MYCQNCRNYVADGTKFCPNCGAAIAAPQEQQAYQQQPYQQADPQQAYHSQPSYQAPVYPVMEQPMKWYKFLIYFSLFASAVLNFFSGVQLLTGNHYGTDGEANLVYSMFSGLQGLDILVGILMIAVAAFAIYTRMRLAQYRADGPKMLMILYAVNAIVGLVYVIGLSALVNDMVRDALDYSSFTSNIAMSVAMIFINKKYFDKRKHLFVN